MNAQILELKEQRAAALDAAKEVQALEDKETRKLTPEERLRFDDYMASYKDLGLRIERLEALEDAEAELNTSKRQTKPDNPETSAITMASRIQAVRGRTKHFDTVADAYAAGQFCLAHIYGRQDSREWCLRNGIEFRAQAEGVGTAGGVLVPDVLENTIIKLRESYGVFRRFAKLRTMSSDHQIVPRQTTDVTAYFIGENSLITESQAAWDTVTLTAKKLGALVKVSSEVNEDTVVTLADEIANSISYQFAYKEDICGFNGDGTAATYGGMRGARWLHRTAAALAGTVSAGAGIDYYSEVTAADLAACMALLPAYSELNARWYTSHAGWMGCMLRLLMAQSGASATEGMSGAKGEKYFFGYPVTISQTFPNGATDCSDVSMFLFGDLSQAASFGDRRGVSIVADSSRYLEYDQVAIRGIERFDINVHDVGDGTNPGPIVSLRGVT